MPVSAYLQAGLFVVAAAAALLAAASTIVIPAFWAYLAILAAVMIFSFATLDPDLLRERMRPGGKKPPLALRVFSLVLFMGANAIKASYILEQSHLAGIRRIPGHGRGRLEPLGFGLARQSE